MGFITSSGLPSASDCLCVLVGGGGIGYLATCLHWQACACFYSARACVHVPVHERGELRMGACVLIFVWGLTVASIQTRLWVGGA
jgi:hypothetical protein